MYDTFTLIDALKETYAPVSPCEPREAEGLRDLPALARAWSRTGEGGVALRNSLDRFEILLRDTAADCRARLPQAEGLDPVLHELGLRATLGYEEVQATVGALGAAVRRGLPANHLVDALEEGVEALVQASRELEAWQGSGDARCPLCGAALQDEACGSCGVLAVVPDPEPPEADAAFLALGPAWVQVYEAAAGVATGAVTDEPLALALTALDGELARTEWLARAVAEVPEAAAVLPSVHAAREGLQVMAGFLSTREVALLNRGWARAAEAAEDLQRALARVVEVVDRAA